MSPYVVLWLALESLCNVFLVTLGVVVFFVVRRRLWDHWTLNELRLEGLLRITQHRSESVRDLLDFALHEAIALTRSKIGYIFHYDEQTQVFTLNSWSKGVMQECTMPEQPTTYSLATVGLWGEPIRQRRPIFVNNYKAPNPYKKGYPAGHVQIASLLTIPIFIHDKIVAVVGVANKKTKYDASDVRQLTLLMDSVWNIVERRRAEDELRRSTERLQLHFQQSFLAVIDWDADFRVISWSPAAEKIFGYTAEEVLGRSDAFLVHPESRNAVDYVWKRVSSEKKDTDSTNWNWTKDGRQILCRWCNTPLVNSKGDFIGVATIAEDVTEKQRLEDQLRASERKYRLFAENVSDIAWIMDLEGRFTYFSPSVTHVLGYEPDENAVYTMDSVLAPRSRAVARKYFEEIVNAASASIRVEPRTLELQHIRSDGSLIWAEVAFCGMYDESGQIIAIQGVSRDISDRKKMEIELRQAKEEAEAAAKVKSQFLTTMSHEIRTPLTAILGYTDLLTDPALDATTRSHYLDTVHRNGEHLMLLINDILDLSKIESGRLTLNMGRCNLTAAISDIINMMQLDAAQRHDAISVDYADAIPETIYADDMRLRQAIMNLVGNAVKFTEHGSVNIHVAFVPQWRDGQPAIRIDVSDTGIGIPLHALPNLFQPFTQVDSTTSRKFGGTGLGLAITYYIIRMSGGELDVQSKVGQGSTFTLTVPTGDLREVRMLQCPSQTVRPIEPTPATTSEEDRDCRKRARGSSKGQCGILRLDSHGHEHA
jgi:PAS domain S-box-containing protein